MEFNNYEFEYPPKDVSWLARDVLLFNISIGATANELHLLYELHPDFQVLPTFPTILAYKGTTQDIVDFTSLGKPTDIYGIPSIPKFDRNKTVDGQKRITIHRSIPTSSHGRNFQLRQNLVGVYDKGSAGSVIETKTNLLDKDTGEIYATITGSVFAVGQGGWGGPKGPRTVNFPVPNNRDPDYKYILQTSRETSLLYRLNGDYNPLHADPVRGKKMGFGGPILHGLYTWNIAAHALLQTAGGGQSSNMREFEARFVAPVISGEILHTQIWRMKRSSEGFEEFRFRVVNGQGKVLLGNGRALLKDISPKGKM